MNTNVPEFAHGAHGINGNVEEKAATVFIQDTRTDAPVMEGSELVRAMSTEERLFKEKKLVRKIDIRLLPMLILMYIMNYLDRNNIAAARLAGKVGLQKSLHMTDTQYNVSIRYTSKPYNPLTLIRPVCPFFLLDTSSCKCPRICF